MNQRGNDRPYVKKPPNAFMVYRNEQRLKVLAGLRNSDCAAVNTIIGQMVGVFETLSVTQASPHRAASKTTLLKPLDLFMLCLCSYM